MVTHWWLIITKFWTNKISCVKKYNQNIFILFLCYFNFLNIKTFIKKLATQGNSFSRETFRSLKATYYRSALDLIDIYRSDAAMNGLKFDSHKEEEAVELFAVNIMKAGEAFYINPMDTPFIPTWSRVKSAIPDFLVRLNEAVSEDNKKFILPVSRCNEVTQFVKKGLKDLSISRTSFSWGIPVPKNTKHVIYVWLDALTNYISALNFPDTNDEKFKKFWPADVHIIGKDILRFHAIFWPAFLLAAKLPLPKRTLP